MPYNMHTPWLLLPFNERYDDSGVKHNGSRFYNFKEDSIYTMNSVAEDYGLSHCVGSSHGWLILLDESCDPYILNPFAQSKRIKLPSIKTIPHAMEEGFKDPCIKDTSSNKPFSKYWLQLKQETFVRKVILSGNPSMKDDNVVAVAIYGRSQRLAFCRVGDSSWYELNGAMHKPYRDIICRENLVMTLSDKGLVEAWNLKNSSFVKRVMEIDLYYPKKSLEPFEGLCVTRKTYLVESCCDILLVIRYVGEFVNAEDVPVREEDLLTDESTHPLVCPYKTLLFHVYKLDFFHNEWVNLESLSDRAIFLGGNHSFSLSTLRFPEIKSNSIYFTDDYWERVDEDYLYGGHDIGYFSLDNNSVVNFYHLIGWDKARPVPFWIFNQK